ncbi:NAD(P)H-binding protein, partial [Pyxidicoccus sp. 3LFB2]
LRQPQSLRPALAGVSRAFLALGDAPDQERMECAFIEAARGAGVRHVVKLSAQSAGLPVPVSFGVVHRRIEQTLVQSGMAFTLLRPTFFQQSLLLFASDVRRRGSFAAPARHARIAMVDCRDVADVAVRCLGGPGFEGRVLTLTGPQAHSLPEVATLLGQVRGRPVRFTALPSLVARVMLPFVSGMPRWQSNQVVDLFRALERGSQEHPTADVQDVLARPARPLPGFLAEHADAFTGP